MAIGFTQYAFESMSFNTNYKYSLNQSTYIFVLIGIMCLVNGSIPYKVAFNKKIYEPLNMWEGNLITSTLNIIFSVTNSICLAQCWLFSTQVVLPTLNVNPTIFVIPCDTFEHYTLQCCNYYHLLSNSSSNFPSSVTILNHISARMLNIPKFVSIFDIGSSKFQISMTLLIHKKLHYTRCHNLT